MQPLSITLQGITNDDTDQGIDTWRTVTLPLIRKLCGIEDGLELQIVRRGARPGGGGEVCLRVPVIREVPSIRWTDEGMVKRIRGVAYSTKVSSQNTNRWELPVSPLSALLLLCISMHGLSTSVYAWCHTALVYLIMDAQAHRSTGQVLAVHALNSVCKTVCFSLVSWKQFGRTASGEI